MKFFLWKASILAYKVNFQKKKKKKIKKKENKSSRLRVQNKRTAPWRGNARTAAVIEDLGIDVAHAVGQLEDR